MTATATATGTVAIPRSEIARALLAAGTAKSKALHIDLTGEHAVMRSYSPVIAISTTLDAPAGDAATEIAVPRTLLASVLPYLEPDCRLSINGDDLKVASGESEFELRTMRLGPEQPPTPPTGRHARRRAAQRSVGYADTYGHSFEAGETLVGTWEAPVLVETLRRALRFASTDQTRPVLCNIAIYPESNVAAATDSYRLAIIRYGDGPDEQKGEPFLLRTEAAASLLRLLSKKLGTVTVTAADKFYRVEFEDTRWSITRSPGEFPSYWNLLPDGKSATTLKVDREDLLAASRAASAVVVHGAPLRLHTNGAGASIKAHSADVGAMTRRLTSADVSGEGMEIGFNPRFMADVCAVAPVERLTMTLIGPLRPALIEAARDKYLLMPVRLNV